MPHGVFCDWLSFAIKIVIIYFQISSSVNSREVEKLFANVTREMALFIINQLIDIHLEIQHEVIGKFLSHSLFKDMGPLYFIDPRVVKHKYDVLQNMK
jgi:hypothetical protein